MKWIKVHIKKPMADVDVFVVTKSGKKGVARYWYQTGKWLTKHSNLTVNDEVIKWKYAQAA